MNKSAPNIKKAKAHVRAFHASLDKAHDHAAIEDCLAQFTAVDWLWRGMHPFYEQTGATDVVNIFWKPLKKSFTGLNRRPDVFFAGANDVDGGMSLWVCEMGHLLGGFDHDWLDIPATGRMCFLRYAEFHKFDGETIVESALFIDILGVMKEAGVYPLPPMTGASFVQPGPKTHDGLLFDSQAPDETAKTIDLVNRMIDDLDALNKSGNDIPSPGSLAPFWHDDMIWFGPTGIGASFTIDGYQKQHQLPFRQYLGDKTYNGHIARIAEGNYLGFFGWPNLNNKNRGGFLGLPQSNVHAEMRIVDIYRRDGNKLAENWVFIDLLHYLSMQGLDVLKRLRETRAPRGSSGT
jgi:hypothetical protein